jgi:hypothetical protein
LFAMLLIVSRRGWGNSTVTEIVLAKRFEGVGHF